MRNCWFKRTEYKDIDPLSDELAEFLAEEGLLDDYKEDIRFLTVDTGNVENIENTLKEANKPELLKEFNRWVKKNKKLIEEGFELMIGWE